MSENRLQEITVTKYGTRRVVDPNNTPQLLELETELRHKMSGGKTNTKKSGLHIYLRLTVTSCKRWHEKCHTNDCETPKWQEATLKNLHEYHRRFSFSRILKLTAPREEKQTVTMIASVLAFHSYAWKEKIVPVLRMCIKQNSLRRQEGSQNATEIVKRWTRTPPPSSCRTARHRQRNDKNTSREE